MSGKYHVHPLLVFLQYFVLIVGAVIMVIPFIWTLSTSLSPDSVVISFRLIPQEFTFANYIRAWNFSRSFDAAVSLGTFIINSAIVAISTTILGIIVDSMAGYVLAKRNVPGSDLLFYAAIVTLMIPFYVIAVPLFLQVRTFGWLNTFRGMIIPFIASGFGVFMFRQYFQTIPTDVEEAARIDGCSTFRIYWWVMMPLAKPVIGTMAVFKAMWSWNQFLWPLLIISDIKTKTLPLALTMFRGINVTQWGTLTAGITISTLPIVVLYLCMQKAFHKGIMLGAVKG